MKNLSLLIALISVIVLHSCKSKEGSGDEKETAKTEVSAITLPEGFSSLVVADSLGSARHIAVNGNGDIYVKLEKLNDGRGILRLRDTNNDGRGILRLRDTNNDGTADDISGFGNYEGTGIAIKNGYLYASSDDNVYRYKMENNEATANTEEMIVEGLLNKREHS